ncbi:MAG: helix-turn-helix domain-containing protein [Pyrinomonadaceae bacterium]
MLEKIIAEKIGEAIIEYVAPRIQSQIEAASSAKEEEPENLTKLVYTEKEAARLLGIDSRTLRKWRRDGEISYTYIHMPTRFKKGKPQNGVPGYMLRHLTALLENREILGPDDRFRRRRSN